MSLNKTDKVFTSTEVEDVEAAARTLLEATSEIDWWFYAAKSLGMRDTSEKTKAWHLLTPKPEHSWF